MNGFTVKRKKQTEILDYTIFQSFPLFHFPFQSFPSLQVLQKLHQGREPWYLHYIFFLIHILSSSFEKQKVVVIAVFLRPQTTVQLYIL